ncbi:Subtilisin-like protease SBT2.6 [Linum grandiflorum]
MASILAIVLVISMINILSLLLSVEPKVFMILMEEDPVFSVKSNTSHPRELMAYKQRLMISHDLFLESILKHNNYTKLYSYTHLLNGFAVHVDSDEVISALKSARGVRAVHEDVKMQKLTTHTPDFLGIPTGVWPALGGPENSGDGVVIGLIDTGINPLHPSFRTNLSPRFNSTINTTTSRFKGKCDTGVQFPSTSCNGKIVGAQYFARAAIAAGDFNATRDFVSPFDADGHGSHTASTAAGNHHIPVIANGFNYGYASGMAPGARIAVYKALYTFGGYMSDVVAAVDQAVEDGVDILSLSIGPSSVPPGPSAFLNVLEMELLFATKAGIFVVQAAGNGGPSSSSILSFSPWITTVAASITDRRYNNTIILGNGLSFSGTGLAPPTSGTASVPIAAAADVSQRNTTSIMDIESCQHPEHFIPSLAHQKLIICTYNFDFEYEAASIATVADTIQKIGATGFIITMDPAIGSEQVKGTTMTMKVPAIILNNMQASSALWEYYNSNTKRGTNGEATVFSAEARIMGGRQAFFTGEAPVVASYSSRGPDVNNALLQTADVLKPNIMAPGSSIWAAWSPNSEGDPYIKGQNFALVSGTSMATPHIAGVAALIKHKHPKWSPAAITSAMMTTADRIDRHSHTPILAQSTNQLAPATPFDLGSGSVNPAKAIDPGLVFNAQFDHYVQFLCSVPGVDDDSVRRALGSGCPQRRKASWCSDLNTPSVTISNLVRSRKVIRTVTNVGAMDEFYRVTVRKPVGVNITVTPRLFVVRGHTSRRLRIVLHATNATKSYTFGEMVMHGSRRHVVRVPIAVYVSTS